MKFASYMRKGIFVALTVVMAGGAISDVCAQETLLTLDQAIDIALEKGYDMKSLRLSLIQAEQNRLAARYRFRTNADLALNAPVWSERISEVQVADALPVYNRLGTFRYQAQFDINQPLPTDGTLTLRTNVYQSEESNYFAETDNTLERKDFLTSLSIQFRQPLFTYNRLQAGLREAELNYENTSLTLRRERLNVVYSVTNSFFSLYQSTRQYEIAQETFEQQEAMYNLAKLKFEAGLIPEVDALRTEVDMATARSDLYNSESQMNRQKEQFKIVLGLDLDEVVGAQTAIDYSPFEVDLDLAIAKGLANRTEIREQEIAIELSKMNVTQVDARSEISADLTAFYDFTGYSDPNLPLSTSTSDLFDSSWRDLERRPGNRGVTFTVNVPVWDWGVNSSEVESARANLRRSELQLEEERKQIENSVVDAVRQLKTAENRLEVLKISQDVAQRTYDISLERFNNGEITSQDLALDNKSLSSAKLSYLNAYISYKLAVADLQRKTLWNFETDSPIIED